MSDDTATPKRPKLGAQKKEAGGKEKKAAPKPRTNADVIDEIRACLAGVGAQKKTVINAKLDELSKKS